MDQQKTRLSLNQRIDAPTPRFWRIVRHIGMGLAAVSSIASLFVTGGGSLPLVLKVLGITGGSLLGYSQIQVAGAKDDEANKYLEHTVETIKKLQELKGQ